MATTNATTRRVLASLRAQTVSLIRRSHSSVDEFCRRRRINRATIYNLIRGSKDFQISTLAKIARALDRRLLVAYRKSDG